MVELLVILAIVGILAAMAGPQILFLSKPLQNATDQTAGIFKQARMRSIATTSAYRIRAESTTKLKVEAAKARSCDATT